MDNKRKSRLLILVAIALIIPMVIASLIRTQGNEQDGWPYDHVEQAETVGLTEIVSLLQDPVPGRVAAVLDDEIFVRTPARPMAQGAPMPNVALSAAASDERIVSAQLPFPSATFISEAVNDYPVDVRIYQVDRMDPTFADRILQFVPILLLLGLVLIFLSRGASKSLGLSAGFEMIEPEKLTETFEDVAGIDEARAELEEIVTFLKDPENASRLGGRMPKGAIFDGPPGTGKTLLVRALAKEAGVPFINIEAAGLNQFFVGAGASKLKKAFTVARKAGPCIVFIDEIDAMGRARGSMQGGAGDEKETTLNQLLTELDGFDSREGVFLVAATNRFDILDPALTRRGRLDRRVTMVAPDVAARAAILDVKCRKIALDPDVDVKTVARMTYGFTGADLDAFVNEAALAATRAEPRRDTVTLEDFAHARDKLLLNTSGGGRSMSEADRRITAYHEAGHAVAAHVLENTDPIEKVTITPQGGMAGYVMQLPTEDRTFMTLAELRDRIVVAAAGRSAEMNFLDPGHVTSGASSDIEQATKIAREMVTRFGMSEMGFVKIDTNDGALFDPDDPPLRHIRKIIAEEMSRADALLEEHAEKVHRLAEALIARETLTGKEVTALFKEERA